MKLLKKEIYNSSKNHISNWVWNLYGTGPRNILWNDLYDVIRDRIDHPFLFTLNAFLREDANE